MKRTRSNLHITDLYGTTAGGTVMTPCFIFDTMAKDKNRYQLKSSWCEGLPSTRDKYGSPTIVEFNAFVSVRKGWCTDEELMQDLIEKVYLPLCPNVAKITTHHDYGNYIPGSGVYKTDTGQGRLSVTWESVKFR